MNKILEDFELRSEEIQDVLEKAPSWLVRWGSLSMLGIIIILISLTYFIKYPDVIVANAVITTKIPPQKGFARISAKFDTILVNDKDEIKNTALLAILENSANYIDVYKLKSITDSLVMDYENISFPFYELPPLLLGEIEDEFSLFENSFIQYDLNKQLQPHSRTINSQQESFRQVKDRIGNLTMQLQIYDAELNLRSKNFGRYRQLFENGAISEHELEKEQIELFTSQRNFETTRILLSELKESLNDNVNEMGDLNFLKKKDEVNLKKNVTDAYDQLKKAIEEWEFKYAFKARMDGQVPFLNFWNALQNVNAGDLVFTIIPSANLFYIAKLKISDQNAGKIKIGHKVYIKMNDFPDYEYGMLKGKIVNISNVTDSDGNYIIDVVLPKNLQTTYDKSVVFKNEMKGQAEIITDDLRLIERSLFRFKQLSEN